MATVAFYADGVETVFMQDHARRQPVLSVIARHWSDVLDSDATLLPTNLSYHIGWGEPFCFKCGWLAPAEGRAWDVWNKARHWLDRAHLIDRCFGGLDGPQNTVPLCQLCHFEMPSFEPGQESDALRWVAQQPERASTPTWGAWQVYTDVVPLAKGPGALARERGRFYELMEKARQHSDGYGVDGGAR